MYCSCNCLMHASLNHNLRVVNKSLFLHKKSFNSALTLLKLFLARLKSIYIF